MSRNTKICIIILGFLVVGSHVYLTCAPRRLLLLKRTSEGRIPSPSCRTQQSPWRPSRYGRGSCNAAPRTLAKNPRRGWTNRRTRWVTRRTEPVG